MSIDESKVPKVTSEINVTPLVDVVLVLLIIFMLVTPLMDRPGVLLPRAHDPSKMPEEHGQIHVTMDRHHIIAIDRDPVPEQEFAARIKEAYERGKSSSIVIEADSRLSYGDVKSALVQISKAGFPRVGLIVHKQDA